MRSPRARPAGTRWPRATAPRAEFGPLVRSGFMRRALDEQGFHALFIDHGLHGVIRWT
jgi:hypothetical protein